MIEILGTTEISILIFIGIFLTIMFVEIYSDKNLK
tara:strand:- start:309 stop:413 length:105 start_codon:yes stop_codon:yes gene_type:complete